MLTAALRSATEQYQYKNRTESKSHFFPDIHGKLKEMNTDQIKTKDVHLKQMKSSKTGAVENVIK